jgi:hypothetical protein
MINAEVAPLGIASAYEQMHMWLIGVVVVDGEPLGVHPQITFDRYHELSGVLW